MTTAALRNEFRRDPALPILVGDDVFLRGIRSGVESGEYVYVRGDLVYGPGDPAAVIAIDEQASVLTMSLARNKSVWPRREPAGGDGGHSTGPPPTPPELQPPMPPDPGTATTFHAEGVLKNALARLWEQARDAGVSAIVRVEIRVFDPGDGFRLLRVVGAIPESKKTVRYDGGYETRDDSTFEISFSRSIGDADPLREFLEPQVRDSAGHTLETRFELIFDGGLSPNGDAPEKLAARLSRFATSAAYVEATAEARQGENA